jgi:acyl-CoA synthetase (AMP-forming)/AMP-acid ligase II
MASEPDRRVLFDVAFAGARPEVTAHSWADIARAMRHSASALARAGVEHGDRVAVCLPDASTFLAYFLGAQALGAIPVPLPPASETRAREAFQERIESVLADCRPRVVVVETRGDAAGLAAEIAVLEARHAAAPAEDVEPEPPLDDRPPQGTAYLQYTSGSTGAPKGVVVTQRNLLANITAIANAAQLGPSDRAFSWLPLYHDMGLIGGLLVALSIGGEAYSMTTRTFVGRPAHWLRCMSEFKATFTVAPNFAYNLVSRHMRDEAIGELDLSHWRRAFNGAEPIDPVTLDRFMERFAPAGFRPRAMFPVYGLAEATLAVAFPTPDTPPRYDHVDRERLAESRRAVPAATRPLGGLAGDSVSFVSVGRALPEHQVRIVDPSTGLELEERCIGEVTVTGPSITPGYFSATGGTGPARDTLRTGDLGYIADGELFIVDRLKDLAIIGGRNIVPSDVERVVAQVDGVRYGSVIAFGLRGENGTDELYVVAGAEPRSVNDPACRGAITELVSRHFGIAPRDVILVPQASIPKTSSGKVRRLACRALYQAGAFGRGDGEARETRGA